MGTSFLPGVPGDLALPSRLTGQAMAIGGPAAVGLAISAAVLLVTGYVDHGLPAVVITVVTVCLFGGLWFVLPLAHRRPPDE